MRQIRPVGSQLECTTVGSEVTLGHQNVQCSQLLVCLCFHKKDIEVAVVDDLYVCYYIMYIDRHHVQASTSIEHSLLLVYVYIVNLWLHNQIVQDRRCLCYHDVAMQVYQLRFNHLMRHECGDAPAHCRASHCASNGCDWRAGICAADALGVGPPCGTSATGPTPSSMVPTPLLPHFFCIFCICLCVGYAFLQHECLNPNRRCCDMRCVLVSFTRRQFASTSNAAHFTKSLVGLVGGFLCSMLQTKNVYLLAFWLFTTAVTCVVDPTLILSAKPAL